MKNQLNKNLIERFSRQIILKNIGAIGQKKILSSKVLIVGAGVASVNPRISATDSVTEVDLDFDSAAFHVFEPNISAAVASKHLYAFATTTLNGDASAGRFTVELDYSVM